VLSRTGGLDEDLLSTARIHCCARQRSGLAARGGRAATRATGDWVSERQVGGLDVSMLISVRHGLGDVGYAEGRNVAIEYRFANGRYDRLSGQLTDLTQRKVGLIVVAGFAPKEELLQQVRALPIPIVVNFDPIGTGLAASMNRPGGNVTGVNSLTLDLSGKQMGLLRDLVPRAVTIAALIDPWVQSPGNNPLGTRATPQWRLGRNCLSWRRAQPRRSTRNLLGSTRNRRTQCS
jgi:hypothetical protein